MLKSLFNRGEPVSPISPTLALLSLIDTRPETSYLEWEQLSGRFVEACYYITLERGAIHSSYHSAEKSINEFVKQYLPHWSLSSEEPEVKTAFVWAIAKVVASNEATASVAQVLLDKLVSNGAAVAALRVKLNPTGLRKVLNIGASRFGEIESAITSRQGFDAVDSMNFLNDQFMHLRDISYLSWHSSATKELADKFPNTVAYRNLRNSR